MGMVKNGRSQSSHGTLKLTVLKEVLEWTDFLHAGANLGKLKVFSMILGWVRSKMGLAIQLMRP